MKFTTNGPWRKTAQHLAPASHAPSEPGRYDLYPTFPVAERTVAVGHDALAESLIGHPCVLVDGYVGVFWEHLRDRVDAAIQSRGVRTSWINMEHALRSEREIHALVEPYLGGDDPIFGTRFPSSLRDFFDSEKLAKLQTEAQAAGRDNGEIITVFYGCGAGLLEGGDLLVYFDLPKNELQFRSRAGTVNNLGTTQPVPAKAQYKRFYFVDWIVLNRHKASLIDRVDVFVDGQRPDEPTLLSGEHVRTALGQMSRNYFRVRPWFEPGPWGGQWIKEAVPQLPQDVPNYAWSFELIVPENGLMLSDGEHLLELSFDWLMYHDHQAVLGDCSDRFGHEFPIRFDFLDTFDGGNLSLQCHPQADYIRRNFGEQFTQDEAYYILDCKPGAEVFLGFVGGIQPEEFRREVERSAREAVEVDVRRFVNTEPASKHDFFLIPNGTIHCSGQNNLVLEISATPYIFTFKIYDWLRMDLDGKPRPLNIDRALDNLDFQRQGSRVKETLVCHPRVHTQGADWKLVHLPTHPDHFYDMHRYEFTSTVEGTTDGSSHVMMLVGGTSIRLETSAGMTQRFNYAETFVVPAAAERYRLINESDRPAMVVKAFVKPDHTLKSQA